LEEEPTIELAKKPKEEHKQEDAVEEIQVEESKKEESICKVVVYQHPHHMKEQQSSRQGHTRQQTYYASTWNQRGNQHGGTWRIKSNARRYKSSTTKTWIPKGNHNQD
jgi:hypothetical protein